jgi:hypothetical protein
MLHLGLRLRVQVAWGGRLGCHICEEEAGDCGPEPGASPPPIDVPDDCQEDVADTRNRAKCFRSAFPGSSACAIRV